MRQLYVDNYVITAPLAEVLQKLKLTLTNGKLREIIPPSGEGGDNIVVTCPNNNHSGGKESHAACNIYIGDDSNIQYGYFRCFVCNDQGNFVKFVSECFNSSEEFAKEWLISNFGSINGSAVVLGDAIKLPNKKAKLTNTINPKVLDDYQDWCPYLAKRGLTPETCKKFNIKYDSKTRQVIFPVHDMRGNLVMLAKRSIDHKTFYLDKGVEKPVYCLDYIMKNNITSAIITEGPFDALLGNQYGMPTMAALGAISDNQIEQINKSCLKVLYTMFDNDDWGRIFTQRVISKVAKRILVVPIPIPNGHKDLGELSYEEFWKTFNLYGQKQ